ncbi:MAG TPA: GAF and ANTAR domain-containing protein [Pseudonocardiaceae bacterium]
MNDAGPVTRALRNLVHDGGGGEALAAGICCASVDGLGVTGAALSMCLPQIAPAHEVLYATNATAAHLEELQYTLGEGPSLQALATGRPVLAPDLRDGADAWPILLSELRQHASVGALFGLPLRWGVIDLGALCLYRTTAGALAGAQLRDLLVAVDLAAVLLLGARTDLGDGQWLDQLVRGRAEIHQATGMMVVQLGASALDAFARLRAHAYAERLPLAEVAHQVVTRRLRFTADT